MINYFCINILGILSVLIERSLGQPPKSFCDSLTLGSVLSVPQLHGCLSSYLPSISNVEKSLRLENFENVVSATYVFFEYSTYVNFDEEVSQLVDNGNDELYLFEFGVSELSKKYKDAHFKYTVPYCMYFLYSLPFEFFLNVTNDNSLLYQVSTSPLIAYYYATLFPDSDYEDYDGWKILKINNVSAVEFLINFAKDHTFYSRDDKINFLYLLDQGFSSQFIYYTSLPMFESIDLELIDLETLEVENVTFDVMAVSYVDIQGFGGLENSCGYWVISPERRDPLKVVGNRKMLKFTKEIRKLEIDQIQKFLSHKVIQELQLEIQTKKSRDRRTSDLWNKVIDTDSFKYWEWIGNDDRLAMINFLSFMYSEISSDLATFFSRMKSMEIDKLIVDMRGNIGGEVHTTNWFLRTLSSYAPIDGIVGSGDFKLSPYFQTLFCPKMFEQYVGFYIIPAVGSDGKVLSSSFTASPVGKQRGEDSVVNFSENFHLDTGYYTIEGIGSTDVDSLGIEPQNLVFLSNGICGSACGMLLKAVQIHKLGRIVTQGGLYNDTKLDYGSFFGATVLELSMVDEYHTISELVGCIFDDVVEKLNFYSTADYRFSFYEYYPFDSYTVQNIEAVNTEIPTGFTASYGDYHFLNNNFERVEEVYELVKYYFDANCSSWEVKKSDNCLPTFSNSIFGNPCVLGKFDNSSCALMGCDEGYYLNLDGSSCKAMNTFSADLIAKSELGKLLYLLLMNLDWVTSFGVTLILALTCILCTFVTCCCCLCCCCCCCCFRGCLSSRRSHIVRKTRTYPCIRKVRVVPSAKSVYSS